MAQTVSTLEERFWSKVLIDDGCWTWTAALDIGGYGQIKGHVRGKPLKAHRVSYEMNVGPIPDGLFVCHHCDNRRCVRPSHLFVGTHLDNMRDCAAKGRAFHPNKGVRGPFSEERMLSVERGEHRSLAKLNDDRVREIRARWKAGGVRAIDLAREYGVAKSLILRVAHRTSWRHVQ